MYQENIDLGTICISEIGSIIYLPLYISNNWLLYPCPTTELCNRTASLYKGAVFCSSTNPSYRSLPFLVVVQQYLWRAPILLTQYGYIANTTLSLHVRSPKDCVLDFCCFLLKQVGRFSLAKFESLYFLKERKLCQFQKSFHLCIEFLIKKYFLLFILLLNLCGVKYCLLLQKSFFTRFASITKIYLSQ